MTKQKIIFLLLTAVLSFSFTKTAQAQAVPTRTVLSEREFNRQFKSQKATANGIKLHYVRGGTDKEAIVLLHGFPQTWHEWKRLMPALDQKHTVIAVDLRGAGDSDKPANGYDKKTMATDVRELVKQLGFPQVNLVGHDIGLMVAYAYAAQYPSEVKKLAVIDAPLPGTKTFEQISRDPRAWHFSFNFDVDFATNLPAEKSEFISNISTINFRRIKKQSAKRMLTNTRGRIQSRERCAPDSSGIELLKWTPKTTANS